MKNETVNIVGIYDKVLDLCHSEYEGKPICFIDDRTDTYLDIDPYWDKHKFDWIKQYNKIVGKNRTVWVYSNGSHDEDMAILDTYFNRPELVKKFTLD